MAHNYAKILGVPAIDPGHLQKAMDDAPITPTELAKKVGISLSYMVDILKGRRTLKRNPQLRQRLAEEIGCPRFWIEHHEDPAEVA